MKKQQLPCIAIILALLSLAFSLNSNAQCGNPTPLIVQNPSFEGPQQPHVTPSPWTNCQPSQTPDTQPGNWGVSLPPTNGSSYLGLVNQVSANWKEGASQQLSTPMTAGTPYTFTIDLANSSTTGGGIVPGCAELEIWGGNGTCGYGELLWNSGNITPYDVWQTYTVMFTPTQGWPYITLYVNSLGCTDVPYILVDNMSPIMPATVNVTATINNHVSCANGTNGMATANITGQNPPFTYQWSSAPVQTDTVLDNVPAGTYTITVTDANTCTATASVTINQPQPLTLTPTTAPVTCYGTGTGSAYMSYSGGTAPMDFYWNNGAITQNNTGLFAGTVTITVTDANNCTASASATISQPAQLAVSGTVTSPTCGGVTNGSINTNISGGTTPYAFYQWNTTPTQSTANATNLSAGNYIITVTDANACTASASFTVNPPPNSVSVSLTNVHVTCYGQSTGAVNSTLTGGSPPFNYQWNTVPVQTTPNISNLPAGSYSVTVTDGNSCSSSAAINVQQPPTPVSVNITPTHVLCYGNSTGSALANASGGIPGYTYSWSTSPVQTTPTAINLSAGSYNVTVSDSLSCTATSTTTINQPAAPLTLQETHVDVLCFGSTTGSVTVTPSGGTSGYTYNWNTTPPQTSATAANIPSGNYTATVTDANNCTAAVSSTITQPATPVTVATSLTQPLCFGQAAAAATATASGGTSGYSYLWNTTPQQNAAIISNIPAGNYTVTATDANNCTATNTIVVSPPPTALTVTTNVINVLCYGESTGSIAANASGSYGNYSYNWSASPPQVSATAVNLPAGSYSVTVTDIQGCTATASDIVTQPAAPLALTTSTVDVLCYGNATGSATVTATGGTTSYNYQWNTQPVQNTATANALVSGNYTVTVTDANSCTETATVVINQPAAPLTATHSAVNVSCNGAGNGSINVTSTGGTQNYAYQWSVTPSVNSPSATGLAPGSYSITVTDANNCSFAISNMSVSEPPLLTISPVVTDVSCPNHGDGSIVTNATGGTLPYTFNWSNGGSSADLLNINGGNYLLTLTDNNNCSVTGNYTVNELPGVAVSGTPVNVLCYPLQNGYITLSATSSFMPLQFSWSNGQTLQNISSLDTGTYSVTVTDAHGCTATDVFHIGNDSVFSIDATPDMVTIDLGETVNLNVQPIGSSFGSVLWTPSYALNCSDCISTISSPVESVTYHVTGTDVNGCIAHDTVRINVIPKYVVFVPNVFTPNGDGANDYFEVFGNKEAWKQFNVEVFNRLGEKVYESNDMNFRWDGTFKGVLQNPAVYVYLVKVVYIDNYSEKLFKGSVTLLR
jgi:gliding motility-associated-like protein